jgi:16S rRNA (uracil1498-N3)-methyltransferase
MTRRFYAPLLDRLDAVAIAHARVLRLKDGDELVLFDGRGREARATIVELASGRCSIGSIETITRDGPALVLVQCLPKGGKIDDIVRMATELGATAIHLAHSERSVARPDDARAHKQLERLARIASEAARQSLRSDVPDLVPPAPLADVIARAPDDARKIAFAIDGEQLSIEPAREAWVVIGPEGGLAPGEIERARHGGFRITRLEGPVLRVETAAPVALAIVRHELARNR